MFSKFWAMRMYGSMLRNTSLFCRLPAAFRVVGVIKRHTQFQFVLRGSTLSFISPSFLSNCWPGWLPVLHHMQKQQIYIDCLNSSHGYKIPSPCNKSLFCITHSGLLPWSNPNWYSSYFPKDPRGNTGKKEWRTWLIAYGLRGNERISQRISQRIQLQNIVLLIKCINIDAMGTIMASVNGK